MGGARWQRKMTDGRCRMIDDERGRRVADDEEGWQVRGGRWMMTDGEGKTAEGKRKMTDDKAGCSELRPLFYLK